jgi:glycosyltransferase involved in cell wall biosynthesis
VKRHVLDLGFIEKAKLPKLLALADVLVQPGRTGAFNDYRLPSKLPEFLAIGKPVALPTSNLAALMQDGREAVFLPTGTPEEIADTCQRLFGDAALRASLAENGVQFARKYFDLATNTRELAKFYTETVARPARTDWSLAEDPTTSEASIFAAQVAEATKAGTADIAAQTELLANVVRQLEQSVETAARHRIAVVEADRDAVLGREKLTQQHVKNIEDLLAAAREHAAGLEKARDMTQVYADNLAKDVAKHKQRRDQADVLLRTARQQVTAYENALLGADAEIESLKDTLEETEQKLATSRDETAAEQTASAALRAAHAAELAAAADRLAQAEAIIRSRDAKIKKMTSSFSWKVTSPFRDLRRMFVDRPEAPAASGKLLGNIDYPQDWSNIAPTLNVRGWSLHRDRLKIKVIRAKLGDTSLTAQFGVERLDVLDHFRDYPGAERCGWIVKAEVPKRGSHILLIEVQDETDVWHIAVSREVKRTANAVPPPPNTYGAWIAAYDSLTPEIADKIRSKLAGLKRRPLISVLMPTYNTPEKWLVAAIESVRNQLYDNWELCIADDASKELHVRKVLERYQKKDPRIKVVFRETNGHISAASNSALELAHGEFIALLDHDDEIRAHALACVALELDAHPNADLVYSDEDKKDENGHRYDHYFKPDWNPDLFRVQNYVSHLGVYRTLLVREVGGFRVGYEGSQDWDLAMRVTERSASDRIRHIPKILYHWRSVPGSTAMLIGEKSYATQAAEKVITEHFIRTGVEAKITPTKGSYWRVHYPVPDPAPRVTLVIPTRNRLNVLKPCVESLLEKTTYANFEILIVDNDSDDAETLAYLDELRKRDRVRVVHFPGEFNFSAINNFGVSQTDAPLVGLLNNDLEVIHGDWLDEMVSHALRPEIGCVGAKLYYPDDRIQHAGVILGIGGVAAHAWQTHPRGAAGQAHRNLLQQNLSAVTAACLVIRREVFQQVDGLDEKLKVAFNDVDFCLKVRAAGYRNLWTPYAELYHHESASRGAEDTLEKRDRFRGEVEYIKAKWGDAFENDPAYNPNLTLTINDFTLSTPPRPWPPLG